MRSALLVFVLLVLPAPMVLAEEGDRVVSQLDRLADIVFTGGTMEELIQSVEKDLGSKLNIICSKDALSFRLPAFSLRGVSVRELFLSLQKLHISDGANIDISVSAQVITVVTKRLQVKTVSAELKVFDVRDLVPERFTIEDLVTAIETAWEMKEKTAGAVLKFHEETHLLIARGTTAEINVVDSILGELRKNPKKKATGQESVELRRANDRILVLLRKLSKDLHAKGSLDQVKIIDQTAAELRRVVEFRQGADVGKLKRDNDRLQQTVEHLEKQITELRARITALHEERRR